MFDSTSRYYALKDLKYIDSLPRQDRSITKGDISKMNDRTVSYKERRFLPHLDQIYIAQDVTVIAGDRLDNISSSTIGDPEQFWRICDANEAMHPLEMTEEPGKRLHIGIQR